MLITTVNHAKSEPPYCDDVLHNNVALEQSNDQVNYALIFAETMHEEAFIRVIQIIKVRDSYLPQLTRLTRLIILR